MPLTSTPLPQADRSASKADRVLVQQLERAVVLLRKALALHDVGEAAGTIDDTTRETIRKLRAGGRSHATHALEQDRRP